jgi:hypothetical protein
MVLKGQTHKIHIQAGSKNQFITVPKNNFKVEINLKKLNKFNLI